jgi:hypothetical protein
VPSDVHVQRYNICKTSGKAVFWSALAGLVVVPVVTTGTAFAVEIRGRT